ncbi:cysteine synthase A [Candidatus Magnetaquicoccus inordinatus]|uniref:cysteine synthase A n=1 Tax=Candidatus Magnetaquicoccus inordinatus TaxID=2496818 RepID=UPI00102C5054|nr:cysteine synthase A [Candidatus Magnetaquicoccus inordinatus]
MAAIYPDITATIGRTPLVRINRLSGDLPCELLAKLEFFNPTTSMKDRIGLAMIEAGRKAGQIRKDTVIIEPTSGNTGIALACVCAAQGLRLILTMPDSMSLERRNLLRLMGAELVLTPAAEGMRGAIDQAKKIMRKEKNSFMPNQFINPINPQIHADSTAQEILQDTDGKLDVLVAGVGTGGSLSGIGKALRAHLPQIQIIAVEPDNSPVLSGGTPGHHNIQGIGAGFVPQVLDTSLISSVIRVEDGEAQKMMRDCARLEGICCGISSGAVLAAALQWLRDHPERALASTRIVALLPDFAERYLSTELFRDEA